MNIFKNRYFLFISFLSFMKPAGFDFLGFDTINFAINFIRIVVSIIIFIKYFYLYKKFSAIIICEFFLFLVLLVSTIYNEQDITRVIIFSVSVLAFSCFIEICLSINFKYFLITLFYFYFILIGFNLVYMYSIMGFQIGNDEFFEELARSGIIYNILTTDNSVGFYAIPALVIGILYSYIDGNKYNLMSWILYIMILLTEIVLWSATSIVGVCITLAYIIIIYDNKKFSSYFNTKIVFGVVGLINIGFTFFNIQNLFSFIIVDILQKDVTMTGRTVVWKIGFDGFNTNPIIGCGFNVITIDNGIVQILFQGGILALIFLLLLIFVSIKKVKLNINFQLDKFFSLVLSAIIVMSISESWFFHFGFYIILNFVYNVHAIQRNFIHYHVRHIHN